MDKRRSLRDRLDDTTAAFRAIDPRIPDVAVVLGSGLGAYAETLAQAVTVPYDKLPHLGKVTVPGHAGRVVVGQLSGETPRGSPVVAILAGRIHLYEGHSAEDVAFNVRWMAHLGARVIVLTNAAGAVSPTLRPGDLVLISDHLNLQGHTPLLGPNDGSLGPRFPDMTDLYDSKLRAIARTAGESVGLTLREGVYAGLLGPSYETPAEVRMLRTLGADMVGMSTVAEAIVARHMGARVLGISCVTNLAAGVSATRLSHAEVEETAAHTRPTFAALLDATLKSLPRRELP